MAIARLRPGLDFIPARIDGRDLVVVQDQLGVWSSPLVLTRDGFTMLQLFLEAPTRGDAVAALGRHARLNADQAGQLLDAALRDLDEQLLFSGPRFSQFLAEAIESFGRLEVRDPICAGLSYPDEVVALQQFLDELIGSPPAELPPDPPAGLVSPHIELRHGAESYRQAYRQLRGQSFDRVVVLGVGHRMTEGLFCLTDKHFRTPLGTVRTDREAVASLREAGGFCLAGNDYAHRSEHSIEFQVLMLQATLARTDFTLVPILCGSFHGYYDVVDRAGEIPGVGAFLAAIRALWLDPAHRTLLLAGVDFSHVGPKFGHALTARDLEAAALEHDRALIEALGRGDPCAFWTETRRVEDRYNVCGQSAMSCYLEVTEGRPSQLLTHQIWHEAATSSAVSFAALAMR